MIGSHPKIRLVNNRGPLLSDHAIALVLLSGLLAYKACMTSDNGQLDIRSRNRFFTTAATSFLCFSTYTTTFLSFAYCFNKEDKMAGAFGAVAARASTMAFRKSLPLTSSSLRTYATVSAIPPKPHHRVVIVGGGTAGVTVAAQLLRTKEFQKNEIAILDPAKEHHYQPGWTLVGSGLRPLSDMSRPLSSLVPENVTHYPLQVANFDPENNELKTADGVEVSYEYLVVAPGLEVNFGGVKGLPEALQDPSSKVSSIYSNKTVEQVWQNIQDFKKGTAVFTQPAGVIKCAGAPQKILWMALSQWEKNGVRKEILPYFATGAPAMFAVPKYSKALEELRVQRQVEGLFQHNLVGVDVKNKVATFKNLADNGKEVQKEYGFLHVTPPQKPWDWVAKSPLGE